MVCPNGGYLVGLYMYTVEGWERGGGGGWNRGKAGLKT